MITVSNVVRIHCSDCGYAMQRKPHLHDGTVTTDPDKNRLVEINGKPSDDRLTKIQQAFACELHVRSYQV